jgi:hypothetical protein
MSAAGLKPSPSIGQNSHGFRLMDAVKACVFTASGKSKLFPHYAKSSGKESGLEISQPGKQFSGDHALLEHDRGRLCDNDHCEWHAPANQDDPLPSHENGLLETDPPPARRLQVLNNNTDRQPGRCTHHRPRHNRQALPPPHPVPAQPQREGGPPRLRAGNKPAHRG